MTKPAQDHDAQPEDAPEATPAQRPRTVIRKKPATRVVSVAMDPSLADAHAEAVAARDNAKAALDADPANATKAQALVVCEQAVLDASEALAPTVMEYRFQALGGDEFEDLKNDNPPTPKQRETAQREGSVAPQWDPNTFQPSLVAAALVDPEMTREQLVAEIWTSPDWNLAERMSLFMAALDLQYVRKVPDLGKGSGLTPS